jgi:hypothetical protein
MDPAKMIPGDRRHNENHSAGFPTFGLVTRASVSRPLEFAVTVAVPFLAADSMLNANPLHDDLPVPIVVLPAPGFSNQAER